jgi:hypothetical protein
VRLFDRLTRSHLKAEITRLRIAAVDMQHAARGAAHIAAIRAGKLDRMNGDAEEALKTGVVVSYVRPFTSRQGIGPLSKDKWEPVDERQAELHRALIFLRNKRYAHTDETGWRGVEDVFGDSIYSEVSVGILDEWWPEIEALADAQSRLMDALANRLQEPLRELGA